MMQNKKKIAYLIGACVFTVIALAAIQGYFIYNTYKLTEREVNTKIRKQITELEDHSEFDAIKDSWMEQTGKLAEGYVYKKIAKKEYVRLIQKNQDSLSDAMKRYMEKSKKPGDFEIGYSDYLTSLVIINNNKTDSVYNGKLLIFDNKVKSTNEISSSTGKWQNTNESESDNPGSVKSKYTLSLKTEQYYSFASWQKTILGQMAGLLLFSVVLMFFVVYLYYLSIKNLINQKRIADIKTDFVNNITHEFQTPLATMDIAIKTLQRKEDQMSNEEYKTTLSLLERQNSRLQKLFQQVANVSVNPVADTNSSIEIGCNEIKEIIEDFRFSNPEVLISCQQIKEMITLKIDRFHLHTILINLLDNAVKYGATQINIELNCMDNTFLLSIKDDGKGISPKEHVTIFDKFYRVEKGNLHDTKGLGLGLFYVKQLVEAYRGDIKVTSEENKGALFLISIPL
ncbi:sensor histidine kinase [Flavobacterium pectinovorum]|uniref:sensor histidine kinase n=1 Tax=Flavobacterium pectinovorum TaxID=29533 RepID=UPI001FACEA4D|nr:HAMP domain-containing sensor histidine kinase [Flavobacterium pectinovorum]MCI9844378.1 HAMP domain-containing histidine kinase [Flavobacterium pectinovorum]